MNRNREVDELKRIYFPETVPGYKPSRKTIKWWLSGIALVGAVVLGPVLIGPVLTVLVGVAIINGCTWFNNRKKPTSPL